MKRKILSLLLVFAMLLSMMPTYAFAAEGTALDISAGAIEITENGEYTITGTRINIGTNNAIPEIAKRLFNSFSVVYPSSTTLFFTSSS